MNIVLICDSVLAINKAGPSTKEEMNIKYIVKLIDPTRLVYLSRDIFYRQISQLKNSALFA